MIDDDDAGKSFLRHMAGKPVASLTSYANLIYAGLAKVPVPKSRTAEFKADLLGYVSRCEECGEPVGGEQAEWACHGCESLHYDVRLAAMASLTLHRNDTFYCLDYDKRPRGSAKVRGEEEEVA